MGSLVFYLQRAVIHYLYKSNAQCHQDKRYKTKSKNNTESQTKEGFVEAIGEPGLDIDDKVTELKGPADMYRAMARVNQASDE